jgi:hypothetical protein
MADGRRVAPDPGESWAAQASLIHSDRESLLFSASLSIFSVRESAMEIEYRTIQISLVVHLLRFSIMKCTTNNDHAE